MEERSLSVIRISVRNLVEFVLRSGDLDNRRTAGAKKEAMQAGGRLHRKIQMRMGSEYRAEVSLKHTVDEEEFKLLVEGRADGVIEEFGTPEEVFGNPRSEKTRNFLQGAQNARDGLT